MRIIPLFISAKKRNNLKMFFLQHIYHSLSIPFLKLQQSFGALCAHRFAKISERRRVRKIEFLAVVIG